MRKSSTKEPTNRRTNKRLSRKALQVCEAQENKGNVKVV